MLITASYHKPKKEGNFAPSKICAKFKCPNQSAFTKTPAYATLKYIYKPTRSNSTLFQREKSPAFSTSQRLHQPSIVLQKELNFLQQFAAQQTRPWKYMVDLTEVRFAHPFNPFLLRRFKRLHQLDSYTAYAPSRLLRFAIKMTA